MVRTMEMFLEGSGDFQRAKGETYGNHLQIFEVLP